MLRLEQDTQDWSHLLVKLDVLGNCDIFFGPTRVNRICGSFQQSLSSHTEMLQRPTTAAENTWSPYQRDTPDLSMVSCFPRCSFYPYVLRINHHKQHRKERGVQSVYNLHPHSRPVCTVHMHTCMHARTFAAYRTTLG